MNHNPAASKEIAEGPSCSPHHLLSQITLRQKNSVQGCISGEHKTYCPLNHQLAILSTSWRLSIVEPDEIKSMALFALLIYRLEHLTNFTFSVEVWSQ